MSTDILTHTEAGVLTITLNRLARKNSITSNETGGEGGLRRLRGQANAGFPEALSLRRPSLFG